MFLLKRRFYIRPACWDKSYNYFSAVTTEPLPQPLQGEEFNHKTAKVEQEARVDIGVRGFWDKEQKSFLDIRIFSPLALCYSWLDLEASHAANEREKIWKCGEWIKDAKQGFHTTSLKKNII